MKIVIVGSIAIDHIITFQDNRNRLMGGSACYSAFYASFFEKVGIVGIDYSG